MSSAGSGPDETHHEPPSVHDPKLEAHGKDAGEHAHGDDHGHGGHDDHAHGEVASVIIPEGSWQDMLLTVVTGLAGLGLVMMMFMWFTSPIPEGPTHEHLPAPVSTH